MVMFLEIRAFGGICGVLHHTGKVLESANFKSVTARGAGSDTASSVGGICGGAWTEEVSISSCFNSGKISGASTGVGGISGTLGNRGSIYYGRIEHCGNFTSDITGKGWRRTKWTWDTRKYII